MPLPPALVQRFLAHLEAVREEVAALQPALSEPADVSAPARERLRGLSHRLAGTADGYGFPGVGACARRVEGALARVDPAIVDHARALVDALADAVRGSAP